MEYVIVHKQTLRELHSFIESSHVRAVGVLDRWLKDRGWVKCNKSGEPPLFMPGIAVDLVRTTIELKTRRRS